MARVKEKQDSIFKIYDTGIDSNHPGVILGFEDAVERLDISIFSSYMQYSWYFVQTKDKARN